MNPGDIERRTTTINYGYTQLFPHSSPRWQAHRSPNGSAPARPIPRLCALPALRGGGSGGMVLPGRREMLPLRRLGQSSQAAVLWSGSLLQSFRRLADHLFELFPVFNHQVPSAQRGNIAFLLKARYRADGSFQRGAGHICQVLAG